MKRNSRSSRISWIIFVCNLLLAVVAFVCYFGESSQLGYLAPVSYSVPMNCYILMTYLLFILVVLSVPAVAGGSISLEREKKIAGCAADDEPEPVENHYGKAGGIAWRCSDTDGFGTAGAVPCCGVRRYRPWRTASDGGRPSSDRNFLSAVSAFSVRLFLSGPHWRPFFPMSLSFFWS